MWHGGVSDGVGLERRCLDLMGAKTLSFHIHATNYIHVRKGCFKGIISITNLFMVIKAISIPSAAFSDQILSTIEDLVYSTIDFYCTAKPQGVTHELFW